MSQTADQKLTGFIQGQLQASYTYKARKWTMIHVRNHITHMGVTAQLEKILPAFLKQLEAESPPEEIAASKTGANADIWKDFYKE